MEELIRSVKRVCHAGLDSISLRRQVAARVVPRLGFDATAFSTCDPETSLMTHAVAEGVPHLLAKAYAEVLYPDHCARLSMDLPRAGLTVFSMAEHSRVARAELRAHGMREQLHVSLMSGGRLWGTWCLMSDHEPRSRSGERLSALRRMVPHLVRGLQAAALVDRGLAAVGEDDAPGVLVLDERGRPTLRTPVATRWLGEIADVGLRMPNEVPLAVVALVARLRRLRRDTPATLHIRARGVSGRWYTVRASLAEPDAAGESAAIVVIQPAVPREVGSMRTTLYDLSAREREVVAAVARGESTKAIAESLGVSPHTVIEHIDRACRKIGVRGRKALIAKLFFDGYAPVLASTLPAAVPRFSASS
ncbi:MAG TPA: LuxR C-terminal-related transcriptional regulator [Gemmatimonadaceae bacterium]|nr:LuxR C-terminal-related transcriptional regulator [Gemmatimonadaceae bacterium]